jgi:tRNA-specific 2-thiouridylase
MARKVGGVMKVGRRVVVAMSGGVDSSVAAALLVRQGYDVIGITIKTSNFEDVGGNTGNESSCCSLDGINDARKVAAQLGFPHYVLDFTGRFSEEVIQPFILEYLAGRTPNPCVLCNRTIKWEELLRKADALGATHVATGHYAQIRLSEERRRRWIARGVDGQKDQSYALWGLTQDSLSRTIFPLEGLTKGEVRAFAGEFGLDAATKGESFEICFIPDDDYERFLKEQVPGLEAKVGGGEIRRQGERIGSHRGYPFYTVGQRRGLGIATGEPLYVTGIDAATNRVMVGPEKALYSTGLIARDVNWMKYPAPPGELKVDLRIRYKDRGGLAMLHAEENGKVRVAFDEPRRAVAPGQSAVFYEGDDIVGGGIIHEVLRA